MRVFRQARRLQPFIPSFQRQFVRSNWATAKPLPYAFDALEPVISKRSLESHYQIYQSHVDKANEEVKSGRFLKQELRETATFLRDAGVREGRLPGDKPIAVYRAAAEVINHEFCFNSVTPGGKAPPTSGKLADLITEYYGDMKQFREKFIDMATNNYGNGYTFIVECGVVLKMVNSTNEGTALANPSITPLLGVDFWEHNYYVDHASNRREFAGQMFDLLNWDFAVANLEAGPYTKGRN
jgi:Fe-Mn family superoxide dismutase